MINDEKLVDLNTVTRLGRLDAFCQGGGIVNPHFPFGFSID